MCGVLIGFLCGMNRGGARDSFLPPPPSCDGPPPQWGGIISYRCCEILRGLRIYMCRGWRRARRRNIRVG